MAHQPLSVDGRAVVLLTTAIGSGPEGDDRGLGPAGWADLRASIEACGLAGPGELLAMEPSGWPEGIGTAEADVAWIAARLGRDDRLTTAVDELAAREIWLTTPYEPSYPRRLATRLGRQAPPTLYATGTPAHLQHDAVGFVGSRDADADDRAATETLVEAVIADGLAVVSGGAKGIDITAERTGVAAGGPVVEFPAQGIDRCLRDDAARDAVLAGELTLASPYDPGASWSVGAAMGRNKLIHAFGSHTVVVRSGDGSGGTWEGTTENLAAGWSTVLVRAGGSIPPGNLKLIDRGGVPIDPALLPADAGFSSWVADVPGRTPHTDDDAGATPDGSREVQSSFDEFG